MDKGRLGTVTIDEGDFRYINIPRGAYCFKKYKVGDEINFYADAYNAGDYVKSGLAPREVWGTWTNGDEVRMSLYTGDTSPMLHASIDVTRAFYHTQEIHVFVNDIEVWNGEIEDSKEIEFDFENSESGLVQMRINLPDAVSPSEVMDSQDKRKLGIGLRSLTITYADEN